jgi:hypothetical protein|mmetsp:Transcript_6665/g.21183  ORF Transcript_6665/g.21183 Transcript_6665/m.21183 type:complete len:83 (-) Transcript_6665:4630-4878(-)
MTAFARPVESVGASALLDRPNTSTTGVFGDPMPLKGVFRAPGYHSRVPRVNSFELQSSNKLTTVEVCYRDKNGNGDVKVDSS